MLKSEGMNASCCLATHNVSLHVNQTGLSSSKIYVFLPLSSSTKLTLLMFSVTVGILAFFGNRTKVQRPSLSLSISGKILMSTSPALLYLMHFAHF